MRNVALRPPAMAACLLVVLCGSTVARAQSVDVPYNPGANQIVNSIAVQGDGKTIVGGSFTALGGGTGTAATRNRIGRINLDGTVDPGFNPGTNGPVLAVAVQPDGKILAGGNFTFVGGGTGLTTARSHIARFNVDGSVDATFDPGANLNVASLALQADGKILVGGNFSKLGGGGVGVTTRIGIGRLNANGTIDAGFDPGSSKLPSPGAPPNIMAIVVQPDGMILVGGYFNGLGGGTGTTPRNFIGRLNSNGTVDAFNPGANSIAGVNALALQSDGRILVGGTFTGLGLGGAGSVRANIGRLESDGTVDVGFNPGAETTVLTLGVQADGKILAGGYFKWMGDAGGPLKSVRNYMGRLNSDGSVDESFNPGASNVVNILAQQADGAIVAGGVFDRLGSGGGVGIGTPRSSIGRLTTNTPGVQTLTLSAGDTIVTWARSGGGPEISRVTFELAVGAGAYTPLGNGIRGAGQWTLGGLTLPAGRYRIRARGVYDGGQNGSGSIVEQILIVGRPVDGDCDGDGKTDIVVYRPSTGMWYVLQSGTSTVAQAQFGVATDVPVPGDYDGDGRSDFAVFRPSTGTWFIQQTTSGFTATQWGLSDDVPMPADYDGDRKTDVAVYRPSNGGWFILLSSNGSFAAATLGAPGDVPVPSDYDGDGKADIAVFRPATGEWIVRQSTNMAIVSRQFGLNGDIPIPGDYDGDRKTDIAIYRLSTGTWYVLQSTTNYTTFVSYQWGLPGDIAEPGDYDGDGRTDLAVYRPSNGTWYIRLSSTGYMTAVITQFGLPGDIATPAAVMANAILKVRPRYAPSNLMPYSDFDGDNTSDLTVFRPSNGTWFTLKSSTSFATSTAAAFGLSGDVPVPGDYDGDGKADVAVFRAGIWYVLKSSNSSFMAQAFGVSGDIPVPGDYDGDGKTDIAIFRPSSGTWFILKSSDSSFASYAWGLPGDFPMPGDYDGDRKTDIVVYRPTTGVWYILKSSTNFATVVQFQFGLAGDIAVPADYDGDGKTDLAVWRPSSGNWFISQSSTNFTTNVVYQWGIATDVPVPGDYDGDGKADLGLFRPSTSSWLILKSSTNLASYVSIQWGLPGDIPILKRP